MKCYDKELIINGKAVRSPEQQVYKNMEDIEELQKKIQTWYACSVELDSSDNTVLRSNTNVPDDKESGLLIDPVGNMFNITGGDETTLLITFYASIKGPQGETGSPGASSNDKGTYITHVEPTIDDTIYTLSTGNIDNFSSDNIPVQVNDIIIYIDSDDQPTSVYTVASISGTTLTLSKQGDYAKGKQLYCHTIVIQDTSTSNYLTTGILTIYNDIEEEFDFDSLKAWLKNKGYASSLSTWPSEKKYHKMSGMAQNGSSTYFPLIGIMSLTDYDEMCFIVLNNNITTARNNYYKSFTTVSDNVKPL